MPIEPPKPRYQEVKEQVVRRSFVGDRRRSSSPGVRTVTSAQKRKESYAQKIREQSPVMMIDSRPILGYWDIRGLG